MLEARKTYLLTMTTTHSKVTLAFGQQVTLKEVWGALLDEIDEGDATSAATFRLMPYNHHTPLDRRSAFGFEATPPFHSMPHIIWVESAPTLC